MEMTELIKTKFEKHGFENLKEEMEDLAEGYQIFIDTTPEAFELAYELDREGFTTWEEAESLYIELESA
ncbi:hypothetical protein [Listeria phage P100plus]|uniref:Uncharacterized protein n=3 Tax=Pecentumvirus TaxID=1857844 RepID=A0A6H2A8B2_9CAUD|nr:hypothetical protein QLX42_gp030 [Listeria phage LMTA-57]AID17484.1 hypothetical protein [Listeria phage LMTA-57]QJB22369.1 hypothetical protein [Listeria phage P100plus]QJB22559.1 hypothetical protein [Listeria phage P200]